MQNFAASQAIWICVVKGSMSGARRKPRYTEGSNFFATACASALSSQLFMLPSMRSKTGTLAECIEIATATPW